MIFFFLFFFGLDFLAVDNDDCRKVLRLDDGGDGLIGRRLPVPQLLVLELLLVCWVGCIVVGGPEACLRLLLPCGGGGGVESVGVGVIVLDFTETLLGVVIEPADETGTVPAISFCNT